jgi:hypothetical protein
MKFVSSLIELLVLANTGFAFPSFRNQSNNASDHVNKNITTSVRFICSVSMILVFLISFS